VGTNSITAKGFIILKKNNVTVKNITLRKYVDAMIVYNSSETTITDSTFSENFTGLLLDRANDSTIARNNISNNKFNGMIHYRSRNNRLTGNMMSGNIHNFSLLAVSAAQYDTNTIDTSNLVNGKPIYYIKNATDQTFDKTTNAGAFYCINCNRVIVTGLSLESNRNGVLFFNTHDSIVKNITATKTRDGVAFVRSTGNTLTESMLQDNNFGVSLSEFSNNNLLYHNNFLDNRNAQISVVGTMTGNRFNLPKPDGGNFFRNFETPPEGCPDIDEDDFCDEPHVFTGGEDALPWTTQDGWLPPFDHQVPVKVTIDRVRTFQDACGDSVFGDDPDFYPKVTIGTKEFTKPSVSDQADLFPTDWIFETIVETTDGIIPISIAIFESDLLGDDQCDINPDAGKKSLDIVYDSRSETFTQDSTSAGKLVTNSKGLSENETEICFGISQGDHISFCQLKPVQVVFDADADNDGNIDLVENKRAVILAPLTIHGTPNPDTSIFLELILNEVKVSEKQKTLAELQSTQNHAELFFTPKVPGQQNIRIQATQTNMISQLAKSVSVKETRNITIPFLKINGCLGVGDCYKAMTAASYSATHLESRHSALSLLPLAPANFYTPDTKTVLVGDPSRKVVGEAENGVSITEGLLNDLGNAYMTAKVLFPQLDAAITIVPREYFDYHRAEGIKGLAAGNIISSIFIEEQSGHVAPQEIAHTYGLEHRFGPTNGYSIQGNSINASIGGGGKLIDPSTPNFMCSGSPECTSQPPPAKWSDTFTYNFLFEELLTSKAESELLLVSGVLYKDGAIEFKEWRKLDWGTVTDLTPGPYSVVISNSNGAILEEIPFEASFEIFGAHAGEFDLTPFAFAIPFPQGAAKVEFILNGTSLASVEPSSKLLKDAILTIPEHGFNNNAEFYRNALLDRADVIEQLVDMNWMYYVSWILDDMKRSTELWLTEYEKEQPLQYTKAELLLLMDDLTQRLQPNSPTNN